mmetsp:Transcript_15711/g.47092  ORF Transcript_15711/g.47092 Transcript_15711/m.47092 type:complete len:237 (-) Transcript_15711:17-727(-)
MLCLRHRRQREDSSSGIADVEVVAAAVVVAAVVVAVVVVAVAVLVLVVVVVAVVVGLMMVRSRRRGGRRGWRRDRVGCGVGTTTSPESHLEVGAGETLVDAARAGVLAVAALLRHATAVAGHGAKTTPLLLLLLHLHLVAAGFHFRCCHHCRRHLALLLLQLVLLQLALVCLCSVSARPEVLLLLVVVVGVVHAAVIFLSPLFLPKLFLSEGVHVPMVDISPTIERTALVVRVRCV